MTDNSAELCKSFHDEEKYSESLPFCENSCSRDNGESCAYLAHFYSLDDKTQDLNKLKIYAEKGCKLDDVKACSVLGRIYQYGLGVTKDYDQAAIYYDKSCNLDNTGRFCNQIGDLYRNVNTKMNNYQKAAGYYKKSCELGYGEGCSNYGDLYLIGRGGIKPDRQLVITYYDKACNLGYFDSCNWLVKYAEMQKQKKIAYAEKSCNGNNRKGCVLLGNALHTEHNYQQAMKSYDKACSMYFKEGCSALINLYSHDNDGWKHDYIKALEYSKKECEVHHSCKVFRNQKDFEQCERTKKGLEEGRIKMSENAGLPYKPSTPPCQGIVNYNILYRAEQECETLLNSEDSGAVAYCSELCNSHYGQKSCINLGIIYQNGKGVKQDNKKSQEYFNTACYTFKHDGSICNIIGEMYNTGENVPQDKDIAKKYFKQSCSLGYQKGCETYKKLNEKGN